MLLSAIQKKDNQDNYLKLFYLKQLIIYAILFFNVDTLKRIDELAYSQCVPLELNQSSLIYHALFLEIAFVAWYEFFQNGTFQILTLCNIEYFDLKSAK